MERLWLSWEVRRHWRSLLALALLAAIAVTGIGAAAAGALRALTAQERLDAQSLPATIVVLPNTPGFDWDVVERIPQVAGISRFVVSAVFIDDEYSMFPVVGDDVYTAVEKPVVLDGRMLDPTRLDEVVVTANFLTSIGKQVGDTVTIGIYQPATMTEAYAGGVAPEPDGPAIVATIVGVIRSEWYNDTQSPDGGVLVSPELYAQYPASFLGDPEVGYINALVRLEGGEADIPAFAAALTQATGRTDIDIWNQVEVNRSVAGFINFEAWSLLALAGAAAVAAVFLIGQAFARYATTATGELEPLRAIGLPLDRSIRTTTLPLLIVAVTGAVVGVAGAIGLSALFPIGTAAFYEPAPGIAFQWDVLIATAVSAIVLLPAVAAVASWLVVRRRQQTTRGSIVAAAATRAGLPVQLVMGTRFALEPGRGPRAIPVRPALVGAVIGVTGVVAALTFAQGITDAYSNPLRSGHSYQLEGFVGFADVDFTDPAALTTTMLEDADVVGVNQAYFSVADVTSHDDKKVTFGTFDPSGDAGFVVTEGRLPESASEVALGPTAASDLGVGVGDQLTLHGSKGTLDAKVVGIAFTPDSPHSGYDDGGFITQNAYDALWGVAAFKFHSVQIWLASGADVEEAAARIADETASLGDAGPLQFGPPTVPSKVQVLRQLGLLPQVLAGFLLILAVGSLGHALVTAMRRRRHDVAVIRVLGQTPGQARTVSVTQASVVALVGLVVGVPLGIALGRTLWRGVAESTPVAFADPTSVTLILAAVVAALLIANLLAVWPGHRAASLRVASVLRTE
ncbi:ABC transporter permease [Agromyces sp. Soil535]|uniref:ABC transporter permease n=1 Tax=Agromyces sp. Soil535 TaxID=1736390 RepID=UPI0006F94A72|nr:ABC transporter permease [Agromyces sp. Soil535]KRE29973.1 hypothetical protein ASG80_18760 [Agromyces sp. Soil535]